MADQLTSIGVEFNKPEMYRIFYSVNPGVEVRKWGLGLICSPDGLTTVPDRLHTAAAMPWRIATGQSTEPTPRTPGLYHNDGNAREPLVRPNELVHPSVRIRYHYGGLGLDDAGRWECRALTANQYRLGHKPQSPIPVRPTRVPGAVSEYHMTNGPVTPYYDVVPTGNSTATGQQPATLVRAEQPNEDDDLRRLADPVSQHWVWTTPDGARELYEEHLGMWERMFIRINENLLVWQESERVEAKKRAAVALAKERAGMWTVQRWGADALAVTTGVAQVVSGVLGNGVMQRPRVLPSGAAEDYGYHDIVSWQRADTTPNKIPATTA